MRIGPRHTPTLESSRHFPHQTEDEIKVHPPNAEVFVRLSSPVRRLPPTATTSSADSAPLVLVDGRSPTAGRWVALMSLAQDLTCLATLAVLTLAIPPVCAVMLPLGLLRLARGGMDLYLGEIQRSEQIGMHRRALLWIRESTAFVNLAYCQLVFSSGKFIHCIRPRQNEGVLSRRIGLKPILESAQMSIPVICVHGLFGNESHFRPHRLHLEKAGRITYAPTLAGPRAPIAAYVPKLNLAIREALEQHNAGTFDMVAHSLGGVVARLCLEQHPDLAGKLRVAITLGSPHQGTPLARLARYMLKLGRELHPNSEFLQGLPSLKALAPQARIISVAGGQDLIVYPPASCHHDSHEDILLPEHGHSALLTSRKSLRLVTEQILKN